MQEELKTAALALGFELVGFASADDPMLKPAVTRYSNWLDAGYGASMEYLRRHSELKAHPEKLLPHWKSVVCVALSYGDEPPEDDSTRAQVSLYARGKDYHAVLGEKLEKVADLLRERGEDARCFVDSEPVMDRFWAWRAGLGWLGKNTCLINRKAGSFLFLGGIFTTAKLTPDAPQPDHCGKCRKCIDACPTGAIVEDRFIDSNRCIAYHTIENRGSVPESVMAHTGRWVAGCDICQTVCPWNDPVNISKTFENSNTVFNAPLTELASWSLEAFKAATKDAALARMKYAGFVRNVIIAVANSSLTHEQKTAALAHLEKNARLLADSGGALSALDWAKKRC